MSLQADLTNAIARIRDNAELLTVVVNGNSSAQAAIPGGPVDSQAKTIADLEAEINTPGTGWLNRSEVARDQALAAQAVVDGVIDPMQPELSAASADIDGLQTLTTTQAATLADHETRIGANETDVGTAETNIDNLETLTTSQASTLANHESRIASAESAIASHGARLTTAEGNIDDLDSDRQGLDASSSHASNRLSDVVEAVEDLSDVTLPPLSTGIPALSTGVTAIDARVGDLETDLTALDARMDTLEAGIATLESTVDNTVIGTSRILQIRRALHTTLFATSAQIEDDQGVPSKLPGPTQGAELFALAFPAVSSPNNKLLLTVSLSATQSSTGGLRGAIYLNDETTARFCFGRHFDANAQACPTFRFLIDPPAAAMSPHTWRVHVGPANSNRTLTINPGLFGGTQQSCFSIFEVDIS